VTEAISGTSHPLPEMIGYLINFSFPFLVPAWMGCFSYKLMYIYFVWFDIMNCIGHGNFEAMPQFLQWGPLKYVVYNSCYHSLHHSKFKFNYCLFCPIWDYLCGTVHPTTQALYAKVLSQQPRPLEVLSSASPATQPTQGARKSATNWSCCRCSTRTLGTSSLAQSGRCIRMWRLRLVEAT